MDARGAATSGQSTGKASKEKGKKAARQADLAAKIMAEHKAKEAEQALSLLVTMRAAGVTPDAITFNAAALACQEAGRWEAAGAITAGRDAVGGRCEWPDSLSFNACLSQAHASVRGGEEPDD